MATNEYEQSQMIADLPVEFQYLENLIAYRLRHSEKPAFPDISQWKLPIKKYIEENNSRLKTKE